MTGTRRCIARLLGVVIATALSWTVSATAPAWAGDCGTPVEGRFTAFSDGQWAQTNYRYHDEVSTTATWTVHTSCESFLSCTGTVDSDQGWSAPIRCTSGTWIVARGLPGWEPCRDGSAATGAQKYIIRSGADRDHFDGWDETIGPSGACGINNWLNVTLPFTLTRRE